MAHQLQLHNSMFRDNEESKEGKSTTAAIASSFTSIFKLVYKQHVSIKYL